MRYEPHTKACLTLSINCTDTDRRAQERWKHCCERRSHSAGVLHDLHHYDIGSIQTADALIAEVNEERLLLSPRAIGIVVERAAV